MAHSRCLSCVKYSLFLFNFIFWLVGCLLLAVGIWALVDPGPVREYATDHEWSASIIVYAMITLGSILTIVGFLGCCGAIRGSRCLMTLFFIMLLIITSIFLSVGIYLAVQRDKINESFPEPQKEKIMFQLKEFVINFEHDMVGRKHMEEIQATHKCCGVDKGVQDYKDLFPHWSEYPCRGRTRNKGCTEAVFRAAVERHEYLKKELPKFSIIISAIILSVSLLMVIGMVLSIVLCVALKDELISAY